MKVFKETLMPIVIILIASAIVVAAVLPLAQTEWADGFRTEATVETSEEGFEGEDGPTIGIAIYILPLLKVIIFMGVGGLLTALMLWLIKLPSKFRRRPQETG
ncbi:MAG: hypothetical protein AAF485_17510 [Chloroflexota bacterium]